MREIEREYIYTSAPPVHIHARPRAPPGPPRAPRAPPGPRAQGPGPGAQGPGQGPSSHEVAKTAKPAKHRKRRAGI